MTKVDLDALVRWFTSRVGKLTYSMTGSRNGQDGTADCSGALTEALYDAGASPYKFLHSTLTLGDYLSENSFDCIGNRAELATQKADIILISWGSGQNITDLGNGHCGLLMSSEDFISVDYSSHQGRPGMAVAQHPWPNYYAEKKPDYLEVWRLRNDIEGVSEI